MSHLNVDQLPDPEDRYTLEEVIGTGTWAQVHRAIDNQNGGKVVAIKVQRYEAEQQQYIQEEYRVLRDHYTHPNLPEFHGVYRKVQHDGADQIWFVLEFCAGGSAIELINRMHTMNKKCSEEHIAFILREACKALVHLHKNHLIHRDVRGNNILITAEGEIKLCDFGLTANIRSTMGRRSTCVGSPCWMAPEMFDTPGNRKRQRVQHEDEEYADEDEDDESNPGNYGSRADVWALGITAIELGDGAAPFLLMHPTRCMFQIVRNPPPTLYRPANWSQNYNDFVAECLEKNFENRPFMVEILEHPFFTQLTEGASASDHHFSCELKHLVEMCTQTEESAIWGKRKDEVSICKGYIKRYNQKPERMYVEDLAALEHLSEDSILNELRHRVDKGFAYTFVGDVLLAINSNEMPEELPRAFHNKYLCKSRSENAPHILSVADSAYQDMMHHEEPQQIIFAGESYSGKTTNQRHIIRHLLVLGEGNKGVGEHLLSASQIVDRLVNAGTPLNPDSTRCALQTQLTFGSTGKLSGAIYWVYLLEKLRVSTTDMNQANFHIFYLFYDAVAASIELATYSLDSGRSYRYLRLPEETPATKLAYIRDDPNGNPERFAIFESHLKSLDFSDEQLQVIRRILAAILILGNVRYMNDGQFAVVENGDVCKKVASLLQVDDKKFQWSLENYCIIQSGTAERRKHTGDEARDARDVLAGTIYSRLVDWIVNMINHKLTFGRSVFGDTHVITLTDMFGFECFHRNRTEQLMINSLNEQIQYHYNQRLFVWEMMEQEEEEVPVTEMHFYDNKPAVDQLMSKPHGLFYLMDDATRGRHATEFITDSLNAAKGSHVHRVAGHEFSIAHYTGKLTYDARDLADKNRDFMPPEMVETMRTSTDAIVKLMFTNNLTKTGNLTMAYDEPVGNVATAKPSKWGAALVAEKQKGRKLNDLGQGQYSQVHKMRTLASVFRATSLELLKSLSVGGASANTHFVRCIRGDLEYVPRGFKPEMVHQQLRALAILDTAIARQRGYPQRVSFQEFIRRYKFLAFDFDETVDMTKDNCRLLLIRLKMEGWMIGKTKVFLKYYNVEFLSRLYETQVKKIIKVQSMMRAFLAKRNVATKMIKFRQDSVAPKEQLATDEAALRIQKAFRGFRVRQQYGPLINKKTGQIDPETYEFIKFYAQRWRAKSMFQVLLHYRAARYQDLVNLSQQIHIYNQRVIVALKETIPSILLEKIDPKQCNPALLGPMPQSVHKLPFRLDDIPFFDTTMLCDPVMDKYYKPGTGDDSDDDPWDAPLKRAPTVSAQITQSTKMPYSQYAQTNLCGLSGEFTNINEPYHRDPSLKFNPIGKRRGSNSNAPKPETSYGRSHSGSAQSHHRQSPHSQQSHHSQQSQHSQPSSPNELRARFEERASAYGGGQHSRPGSLKKRAAPRIPTPPSYSAPAPPQRRSSFGKKTHAPMTPTSRPYANGYEFQGLQQSAVGGGTGAAGGFGQRMNPVREMEMRGIKHRSAENEDDNPPFNFQGMLRKTKHNRASMKRTTLDENSMFPGDNDAFGRSSPFGGSGGRQSPHGGGGSQSPFGNNNPATNSGGHSRSSTSHTVYKSSRPTSRQSNGDHGRRGSGGGGGGGGGFGYDENDNGDEPDYGRRPATPSWLDCGNSLDEAVYVNEEIRPGMVIEGYAIEI